MLFWDAFVTYSANFSLLRRYTCKRLDDIYIDVIYAVIHIRAINIDPNGLILVAMAFFSLNTYMQTH